MENNFYISLIVIYILSYIMKSVLDSKNASWFQKTPEPIVGDIYDEEDYNKQQSYKQDKYRLSKVSGLFSFTITSLALIFGLFGKLDIFLSEHIVSEFYETLVYIAIIGIASTLISLPFSYYSAFVIEQKYGFNNSSIKTFVSDFAKSTLLGAVIGLILISAMVWVYQHLLENFWWIAWLIISAFSVFLNFFYSSLIVPLFNKQKPLEDGELKSEINKFASDVKFSVSKIFVIDGSKRSNKANAYFSGFGSKKRIVLYDTLINQMSNREIIAVLAHEIGHYKKKHTIFNMAMGIVQTGIVLYILGFFLQNQDLSLALGATSSKFHLSVIAFGILFSPISEFISIFMNHISRKFEFQADNFAAQHKLAEELVSGLKTLSKNSFSNLTPHPWYVFVNYSHPPIADRIKRLLNIN